MSYKRHNFAPGQVLFASQLNEMEDGIDYALKKPLESRTLRATARPMTRQP